LEKRIRKERNQSSLTPLISSQWDQIFPDTMMTVAAIDRIIHHATIIEIEGESYRKKQSLKK
jgi:DNA replication protein DnaC